VQHAHVGEVRDPRDDFEEPESLYRTVVEQVIQQCAPALVQSHAHEVRVDAPAVPHATFFRTVHGFVAQSHSQYPRQFQRFVVVRAILPRKRFSYLVHDGRQLSLEILCGQSETRTGFRAVVLILFVGDLDVPFRRVVAERR